ncbi:MAG: RidA family protein [Hyphomicrobiales bacterium]
MLNFSSHKTIASTFMAAALLLSTTITHAEEATLKAVNPPGADIPGISQAIIVEGGKTMYLSGHVGFGSDGKLGKDFGSQLDQVFANMKMTLNEAGTDFSSIARITFFVKNYDISQLDTLRVVRDRWVNTKNPPASALIGVETLFHPDVLVEVDAIAILKN